MTSPVSVLDSMLALEKAADYQPATTWLRLLPSCGRTRSGNGRGWCLACGLPCRSSSYLRCLRRRPPPRPGDLAAVRAGREDRRMSAWPPGSVPIVYLPGVGRATLRATEDCPHELKPLAELQYRGVIWSQANAQGLDRRRLPANEKGGLKLKSPGTRPRRRRLRRALDKLADVPLADLQAKSAAGELNGHYFDSLVSDDLVDDLLSWLSAPARTRGTAGSRAGGKPCAAAALPTMVSTPPATAQLVGAEKLGTQPKTVWKTAWKRYAVVPARYPGLESTAQKGKATIEGASLFVHPEQFWPQDNEAEETALRKALARTGPAGASRPPDAGRPGKGTRRSPGVGVGEAEPLSAGRGHRAPGQPWPTVTSTPLTGGDAGRPGQSVHRRGLEGRCRRAGCPGGCHRPTDREAVKTAIAHVYQPWLRDARRTVSGAGRADSPLPGRESRRLDASAARHMRPVCRWTPFRRGAEAQGDAGTGRSARFRSEPSSRRAALGHADLQAGRFSRGRQDHRARRRRRVPPLRCRGREGPDARALPQAARRRRLSGARSGTRRVTPGGGPGPSSGNLDKTGHDEGSRTGPPDPASCSPTWLQRVESLLDAGWQEVRVVTDHGWLLMPKGLPKADLPKYLTATRWRRCAVVKPSATVDLPCFAWFWSEDVRIASPSGIDCFLAGKNTTTAG